MQNRRDYIILSVLIFTVLLIFSAQSGQSSFTPEISLEIEKGYSSLASANSFDKLQPCLTSEKSCGTTGLMLEDQNIRYKWLYYETDHFKVIYPDKYLSLAYMIGEISEDVYSKLSSLTHLKPEKKITVLISDSQDNPNGYVTLGPEGLFVTVYAIRPYSAFSYNLDEYKLWYETLMSHELAHIFHFRQSKKFANGVRSVFGEIFFPNGITPVFYREGFATYFETLYCGVGRGKSSFTEMMIREAFEKHPLNGKIYIDRYSSRPRIWPYTMGCYMYGVSFFDYLSDEYGNDVPFKINRLSGNIPVYSFDRSFKEITGAKISDLWDNWLYEKSRESSELIEQIKNRNNGAGELRPISAGSGWIGSVAVTRDGKKVFYSILTDEGEYGLYCYDLSSAKTELIKRNILCSSIRIFYRNKRPAGLLYVREDFETNFERKNLYFFDLKTRTEDKLTEGGYVEEADLFKDNGRRRENARRILIVKNSSGGSVLYVADFFITPGGPTVKILKKLNSGALGLKRYNFETPSILYGSGKIAFSVKDEGGSRFLAVGNIDRRGNIAGLKRVTGLNYSAYMPKWVDENRLIFISDKNGVYNLYLLDLKKNRISRITNVVSGIFDFDISGTGLVVCKIYSSNGFYLGAGRDLIKGWYSKLSAETEPLFSTKRKDEAFKDAYANIAARSKRYRSTDYIFPCFWSPFVAGNGIYSGVGFFTANSDYIGRFGYSVGIAYDFYDNSFKTSVEGSYSWPDFDVFGKLLFRYERGVQPAYHFGIKKEIIRSSFLTYGGVGYLYEGGYGGIDFDVNYSSVRYSYMWAWPISGFFVKSSSYFNFKPQMFILEGLTISYNFNIKNAGFFNIRGEVLTDFGGQSGFVYTGRAKGYLYAPLNGILSTGYPDRVYGSLAMKQVFRFTIPLVSIERGLSIFPLYFNSVLFSVYETNYQIGGIVPASPNNFFEDIYKGFRFSLAAEIVLNLTLMYDVLGRISAGYEVSPMYGGVNRIYIRFGFSM